MHALHFVLVSPYCRRRGGEDGRKFEFDQGAAIAIAHEPVLAELCVFLFGGREGTPK